MSDRTCVEMRTVRGVCTITLVDIERRNALSHALVTQLNAAIDAAEADESVRVIVLTNEGRVFCAGADLSHRSQENTAEHAAGASSLDNTDSVHLFRRFGQSAKPFVGRIAGHCVAGGMGLAAAMDISVAIDVAKMGFTEVRIGVAPAMISVLCLPKMRTADAADAILRGRRFPASEAAAMGLINRAVPADELDAAVDEIVTDLLAAGPNALAASKQLLARVPAMDLDEAFAWTGRLSGALFRSEEAAEGMAAYLEKRHAAWVPNEDENHESR
ncbi:MAG: enoyl-CoA hydratase-related protein [Acidimicrobiia bacterium]|nr:enoyl-CoA hydratase-related protein [Acidimicrobiia bacterium]